MKNIISLILLFYTMVASTQTSRSSILEVVLTDCDVTKYVSEYGGIDTSAFVLSGDAGDFVFHHGNVDFQVPAQEDSQQYAGIIKKIKVSHAKSVVKIYFSYN